VLLTPSPSRLSEPWVPHSFPPLPSIEAVGKSQQSVDIRLLGSYLQYATNTFNTCSWMPTHRSLTNTDGGYNLGGAGFPHHTHCPSRTTVLRFPLMAPSGLHLSNLHLTKSISVDIRPKPTCGLPTTHQSIVANIYA
jgi:hypothetical protein